MMLSLNSRATYASLADDFKDSLVNAVELEDGVVGGGQLSEKGIEIAAQKGFRTVIDLRTPWEGTADEKILVEKRGLRYVNIPVTPFTLSTLKAEQLKNVLSQDGAKPAIVHCRSGTRVNALWSVYRQIKK
jgi:uncharacterized protein (TIGR01244 family)